MECCGLCVQFETCEKEQKEKRPHCNDLLDCEIKSLKPQEKVYECNGCDWIGRESECKFLNGIGPLCPECGETCGELNQEFLITKSVEIVSMDEEKDCIVKIGNTPILINLHWLKKQSNARKIGDK